jgi:hypothetical protein
MRSISPHGARCLLVLAFVGALFSSAADKKKADDPGTVIAVNVFHEPGLALPDATLTLTLRGDPKSKKLAQATTNFRGQFVFHVPATAAVYVVKASAKGWRSEEKEAPVTGLDRVDLTFNLEPESKK